MNIYTYIVCRKTNKGMLLSKAQETRIIERSESKKDVKKYYNACSSLNDSLHSYYPGNKGWFMVTIKKRYFVLNKIINFLKTVPGIRDEVNCLFFY